MRNLFHKFWRFLSKAWGLLGLIAFFAATHFLGKDFNEKLQQEHRYTIGVVYGTHWTTKAGKFADATFRANGQEYSVSADADALAGEPLVGRRFVVEYHPPDAQHYNVLYLNAPVPDSLEAPVEGWDRPPFAVPAEVLE